MHNYAIQILVGLLLLTSVANFHAADKPTSNEQRVRDYVAACNKRDVDAMMSMVSNDIQWLTVTGDKIAVETQGKARLRESMATFFKSTPSAESQLEWVQSTGSRVAALERA